MKRLALLGVLWSLAPIAQAQTGYAFDRPELLAEQRLWGIIHGARLLARACAQADKTAAAAAWVDWQEREREQILATARVLGLHYFGREDVPVEALSAMLGLPPVLALPPEELDPACATLPAALAQPRYDLKRRRAQWLER